MTKRLPTPIAVRYLLDAVTALWTKPRNRTWPDPTLFANLERRTFVAFTRDLTGESIRDGYPSSTLGGWGGNNGSSVETHALSRPERDLHHEHTLRVIEAIEMIGDGIHIWQDALAAIDTLTSDRGPAPRTCSACTGYRPQGGDQVVAHRTTVGNRLERDTDLCDHCYGYVKQSSPPDSRQGRLPTPHDIAWHDQRGRWQLRIIA